MADDKTERVMLPYESPLVAGVLVNRINRFIATVDLDSGERVEAHCVNTGRMEDLIRVGGRVWLSEAANKARKLKYTWEVSELDGVLLGVNTAMPNKLVGELINGRLLYGFKRWTEWRAEYVLPESEGTRVDFFLRDPLGEHYIEVKNCHLVYPDLRGYFPDSVSERASRHIEELMELVAAGHRATVVFVVQRADATSVRPSDVHDPTFAETCREAKDAGVSFAAIKVRPTMEGLEYAGRIPADLEPYGTKRMIGWRAAADGTSGWKQVKRNP